MGPRDWPGCRRVTSQERQEVSRADSVNLRHVTNGKILLGSSSPDLLRAGAANVAYGTLRFAGVQQGQNTRSGRRVRVLTRSTCAMSPTENSSLAPPLLISCEQARRMWLTGPCDSPGCRRVRTPEVAGGFAC